MVRYKMRVHMSCVCDEEFSFPFFESNFILKVWKEISKTVDSPGAFNVELKVEITQKKPIYLPNVSISN